MKRFPAVFLLLPLLLATPALADDDDTYVYDDTDLGSWVALQFNQFNFASVTNGNSGSVFGPGISLGTSITKHLYAEGRAGTALTEHEFEPGLKGTISGYISWYMGLMYMPEDWARLYAQAGFSYVKGNADKTPQYNDQGDLINDFGDVPDDLLANTFSMSMLVGADVKVYQDLWLGLEAGRLHKDTTTNIRVMPLSATLRYEF